jgi:hypothetical protein
LASPGVFQTTTDPLINIRISVTFGGSFSSFFAASIINRLSREASHLHPRATIADLYVFPSWRQWNELSDVLPCRHSQQEHWRMDGM